MARRKTRSRKPRSGEDEGRTDGETGDTGGDASETSPVDPFLEQGHTVPETHLSEQQQETAQEPGADVESEGISHATSVAGGAHGMAVGLPKALTDKEAADAGYPQPGYEEGATGDTGAGEGETGDTGASED